MKWFIVIVVSVGLASCAGVSPQPDGKGITIPQTSLHNINVITLSHSVFSERLYIDRPVTLRVYLEQTRMAREDGFILADISEIVVSPGARTVRETLQELADRNNIVLLYCNGGFLFERVRIIDGSCK